MEKMGKAKIVTLACVVMFAACGAIGDIEIEFVEDLLDELVEAGKKTVEGATPGRRGAVAKVGESTILLLNKDSLHGKLISVDSGKGIVKWKHGSVDKPIDFRSDSVSNIKFPKGGEGKALTGNALIKLTNGDEFLGRIVSVDESVLELATSYAGPIKIKRQMVTSIAMKNISGGSTIYEGPTDLSKWNSNTYNNSPSWSLKGGVLIPCSSYPIGRVLGNLPDMINFEFEAKWTSYPSFAFVFCSDRVDTYSGNNYSIRFSSSSIQLQRYSSNRGSSYVGSSASYQGFGSSRNSGSAKFNVLVDKKKKRIVLMINGSQVTEWTDPGEFAGKGNSILLHPQSSTRLARFRNIKVTCWDGKLPASTVASSPKTEADVIVFENNDQVSGTIESVKNNIVTLKTSYASLSIPVDRIENITMATVSQERARRNTDDVTMLFAQVGSITMNLESLKENTLKGASENFGDIVMPVDIFSEIKLNIYKEKEEESKDEW